MDLSLGDENEERKAGNYTGIPESSSLSSGFCCRIFPARIVGRYVIGREVT